MAIYRVIHHSGKYHDWNAIRDLLQYVSSPEKPKSGLIFGGALFPNIAADYMEELCRAFDRTDGLLLRHSILSFSPEERIDALDAADIAVRAVRYYKQQY